MSDMTKAKSMQQEWRNGMGPGLTLEGCQRFRRET